MKLLSLILKNFKGIKDFSLDTQGGNISVFGDNAVGKTTLFDAFLWLLFDKDSQNKKDFEIKTLDAAGRQLHNLEHEVEATFEVNSRPITFRKVYAEKWTKKRGSATAIFSGHTVDHFIDGVPVKKGEYASRIEGIANEDIFKLLTNPAYFNEQLHWQKRREILLEVCGDITDAEVIASDKALAKLPAILNGRKLEDHKKVIASSRAEINKELEKIPVRIDEAAKGLPDIAGLDDIAIKGQITGLKDKVQDKYGELSRVREGGETAEKTKQLREAEGRLLDIRNKHREQVDVKIQDKKTELLKLEDQISSLKQQIKDNQRVIEKERKYIDGLESRSARLREEWHQINNQKFEYNQECTCPTCGQQLPEEKLNEAREKAQADFNRAKAQQLETISAQGKQNNSEIDMSKVAIGVLEKEISDFQSHADAVQNNINKLQTELDVITKSAPSITDNPDYTRAVKEKETLEQQIALLNGDNSALIAAIREEISLAESEISFCENDLAKINQYKRGQQRIAELEKQEKELAAEFERLEGELYLTDQFTRAKVAMLEQRINSRFKLARFKLFDTQINGGLQEVCETLYSGVPYSSGLNNAARINVGLDIINTLSEHYNFTAPIFVDNAEAVTKLIKTRGQIIKLVVSETDKSLRVETEANNLREAI